MVRTSVVVVSSRCHVWLERCLASVVAQADEVILVDNGSPGCLVGDVGRRSGTKVVALHDNVGFAAGVNAGVRRARGEIIGVLNDDAIAGPEWLASAATALEIPGVAAVAPKVLFAWRFAEIRMDAEPSFAPGDPRPLGRTIRRVEIGGAEVPLEHLMGSGVHRLEERMESGLAERWRWSSGSGPIFVPVPDDPTVSSVLVDGECLPVERVVDLIANAGSYLSTHGHGGDYGFGAADDGSFDEPAERFAATGAAMVATSATFARLGGFAESYFAYYEDLDWCWRARLAGLRCVYEPGSVVRHVGGATSGGPTNTRVRFLAARNRIHTLARNAPLAVVRSQLRSSTDRPDTGLALALATRVSIGLLERRRLARTWSTGPREVWAAWAGRDEWPAYKTETSPSY